ncbi:MAG: imidazole glycerol phosphate synthase subunit HisH [Frankiaceae bacterium]|nr:imidazole glycerol phosphate synthase subunit HisH [Frankiaceae bacterium]
MTSPSVVVLDYGSGNLRSAERALARVGASVTVTASIDDARDCDGLVVPGVGAFAACMAGIRSVGAAELVSSRVESCRPVLGICVGMQVLYDVGDEHGVVTPGIGVLPGRVTKLDAPVLPHMGWNTVTPPPSSTLFRGVEDERFYFVHSYGVAAGGGDAETVARHGASTFVAAIEHGPLAATQFHPEKSGDAGLALLENWVRTLTAQ